MIQAMMYTSVMIVIMGIKTLLFLLILKISQKGDEYG